MKGLVKYLIFPFLFIAALGSFSYLEGKTGHAVEQTGEVGMLALSDSIIDKVDSLPPRFPVAKTSKTTYEDFTSTPPIDLNAPSNVKSSVEYDPNNKTYLFKTKVGDMEVATPFSMSSDEYMDYRLRQSMRDYYKKKNALVASDEVEDDRFSLKNIKLNIAPTDRLFGPGGVQFKASGYVEAKMGIRRTVTNNPTLSERNRSQTAFDFDEDIQLNVQASVGDKINFDMNYDTSAMFDFDSKRIKLAYDASSAGDEDGILRRIEAGNVSMNTTNSLVQGGTALFGIASELQFGRLRVNSVVSQQEAEARSVGTSGGVQRTEFEFKADEYDENRHFFLAHYFRDNYDKALNKLPLIISGINITKIEVWVTNTRHDFSQYRNMVALADLGESKPKGIWTGTLTPSEPYNRANNMYDQMITTYSGARDITKTTEILNGIPLEAGQDYEKIESARLLNSSEYYFNPQLGYISLVSALQAGEVLGVAYTYTMNGKTYQVGELSSNVVAKEDDNTKQGALFVKMLKPVSLSPTSYTWDLMMKNVYSLGTNSIQKEDFKLEIGYRSDTIGATITYLPEGKIKNQPLLRVMGLDRLNSKDQPRPDGIFDFIEGVTIRTQTGRIYFPVVEPFGKNLRDSIDDDAIANRYVFQELYDETPTVARQAAEKNKFIIRGFYRGSMSNSEINLNTTNVPKGSVVVMAGGTKLVENVDYIVDYTSGVVTILNQTILDANTSIQVFSEGRSFNMQRKTLLGLNLSYDFSKDFTLGGTLMHYYEKPLTNKAVYGTESVKNTLWGLNTSYRKSFMWLTDLINTIPFVNATAPSQINLNAEFAQMIAGHYQNSEMGGYSYLDDFETSQAKMDIKSPYAWTMSSTPADFEESKYINDVRYGNNRAMMSWFVIDPLFTRKNSSLTPQHIKNDVNQLSNHFVREVTMDELFPNRDIAYNQTATLPILNISYYPGERGPYNVDTEDIARDGKFTLNSRAKRWGGITRKMDVIDFEASNIEYIEFWLMNPFVYNDRDTPEGERLPVNKGGQLYFNLGDISEDVLKDGMKFYENGLPLDGNPDLTVKTVWGKVPKRESTVYAFDNSNKEARRIQDVGLNGLSLEEEFQFDTYIKYLDDYRRKLSGDAIQRMEADPFSPLRDPGGDKYHFYRGSDYDREGKSIIDRYKYYNNTEGNSQDATDTSESYSTAARSTPDVEDINQDNTLNESESYFRYKIDLTPSEMEVGKNFIVSKRTTSVKLRNGKTEDIEWYQFKVPIRQYEKEIGRIRDFRSIRFMRMYLTGFEEPTFLRFGTLQLVRGSWRVFDKALSSNGTQGNGTIDVSYVNIEEDSDRQPVNYVLPPGLSRDLDPDQTQITKENEQSLAMKIADLGAGGARAIYKNTHYDMRRFKRLQLFTHLEDMLGKTELIQGDMSVFIRLGADYVNNYYEYEIPLSVTPAGRYNLYNNSDREKVWPLSNMFDFRLSRLTDVKLNRNREMRMNKEVTFLTPYFEYDPDKNTNRITIVGNPSLSDVDVIMIGVRNNSRMEKSGEVWVNELRLTDFDEEGGWAVQGSVNVALSDLGMVNFSGRKETAGFGRIEQSMMQRRPDDFDTYNIATNVDVGRFIPEQAKVSIPFGFAFSKEVVTPKYNPFDQDITLKESMKIVDTKSEKDSINSLARERVISRSMSFNNVRVNIASKNPMPYDPANFSFGYGFNKSEINTPTLAQERLEDYRASMHYSYSPIAKTWEPFKNAKSKSGAAKFARSLGANYLPNNISFNSNINRFYTETMTRDIESYRLGAAVGNNNFLSWSQDFYWDRNFSINWDFTQNLKFTFQSGTRAEIEEPYLQVNKKMNRSAYDKWRDEVWRSIKGFGTPLSYRQTSGLTYQLPFRNIPVLNWITSSTISYNSGYNWDRGAETEVYEMGNTISNQMTIDFNNRFNLTNLYNKFGYLKRVNDRFDGKKLANARSARQKPAVEKQKRRFKQSITLKADTTTTIKHNLNTKKLDVKALSDRKKYPLRYRKVDENTIVITNKDTTTVMLDIGEKEPKDVPKWLSEVGEYSARGLMSVRSLSVNYSRRNETYISGFRPHAGDMLGQRGTSAYGFAPGVGFAFGLDGGSDYIDKALSRDWLIKQSVNINPAIYNKAEKLGFKAEIVPFKGMRIELNAAREKNDRTEVLYMFDGQPKTFGGTYSISTISLASSFGGSDPSNGYQSDVFQKFLDNRTKIQNRLERKYEITQYPSGGFMTEMPWLIGENYDPTKGKVNPSSSDVLIPAFIAAYTGKDVDKISLSAFPSLSSILPNWSLRYDVLTSIPFLKNNLKSLEILHAYQSFYQVGGFNSFSGWIGVDGDLGYIRDELTQNPIPTSPYDITSVNISESFNPLFGINGTLINDLSLNGQFNKTRVLNLNISAYQIVESLQNEFIVGAGYRINEFNRLLGLNSKSTNGFNNDLILKADLSTRTNKALIRQIEENFTQATSGTTVITLMISANYALSRALTMRAYFDKVINKPLISVASYPNTNTSFGISLRYTLIQ